MKIIKHIFKKRAYVTPQAIFEEMEGECVICRASAGATGSDVGNGETPTPTEPTNPRFSKESIFDFDATEDVEEFEFDF